MTNNNGIFKSGGPALPAPPDDVTIPQFILDGHHPLRQLRLGEHLDKPWLIDNETGKAYGIEEIRARTFGLANAIADRWKIRDDDVVCIFSPNHIDYPILIWAAHRLGAIVSCANPSYTESELEYQLQATKATLLVVHAGGLPIALKAARSAGLAADRIILLPPVSSPAPTPSGRSLITVNELIETGLMLGGKPRFEEKRLKPGENQKKLAFLSFSSGTTGRPKAVAIPHYSVIANVLQFAAFNQSNDASVPYEKRRFRAGEDVTTAVLPFFHIYGLVVNLHVSLFSGLAIVVFPKFNWVDFLESIVKFKITHLFIVPPQVVLFVKHPATAKYDLSRLRYCMAGAAPLSPELTVQFQKVVPNCFVGQGYGMTETSTVLTMPPTYQKQGTLGSAGQLVSGTEAKVVKSDGTLGGVGESGELWVRGPQCFYNRYLNNDEANAETFVDGWVRTGDEVRFDATGDMFIVDRLKELIKCRGFQVAPAELEGHLLDHPDCVDVGVVGIPDDYSGEVPMAFVALSQDALNRLKKDPKVAELIKASIKKHISDSKIRYKWLDGGVEFIDAIPKNPSGKLLRRFLRDRAKVILEARKANQNSVRAKL